MPAIAHLIVSLLFSVFLIKTTNHEFNYRHAIIFTFNSYMGPDLFGWMHYYWEGSHIYYFIHGYGWVFIAFLIALPWYYANTLHLTASLSRPLKIFI